ncbi:LemA family protein [Flavitalea antarctica]
MKYKFLLLCLSLSLCLSAFSQRLDALTKSKWDSLKIQLQNRAMIAVSYISYVSDSKTVDRNNVQQVNLAFVKLLRHLDIAVPVDSAFITRAYELNSSLNVALGRTLVGLENDPEFRKHSDSEFLMQKLFNCEKALTAQINSYNGYISKRELSAFTFGISRKI